MAISLEDKLAQLSPERWQLIEQKGQTLIEEELALQTLRKLIGLTQKEMATRLEIAQEGISRLEQRQDIKLSTLRKYIEALGGKLNIVADFPDRPSVSLQTLAAPKRAKTTPS
ncbi:MAG: helix-turn-helix domain-containing protein [Cyanobacteria bacterium J06649_5]